LYSIVKLNVPFTILYSSLITSPYAVFDTPAKMVET
jgi:hypothetical protein